ncbi:methyltransferase domain-containing protein [Arthrobacter sp. zg-Y877]|uniref:methyltransferase domain-containing protein n=1 Tax=Arthrobacter sp. zg-Y877 TaxID=3049074 RepID=UPI0025A4B2B8|nr:methyltransferase domain-containing protein [Arthrobacter sp. zg-Y877]MDM7990243.1 methyltransferase domain-containing protein [Arthrobacter sp. zg-Y877]
MASETYSHGHHHSVVDVHAVRTAQDCAGYLLPELAPGMSLLDVGCGPGSITSDLAALTAPGPVVGLDSSEDVLVQARELAAGRGLANASFVAGNVYDLDFPDETFDVVHAHQVLQHLMDPVAALREMRRVAKPGGLVAVRDADFSGMVWHPPTPELAEWMRIYQLIARGNSAEPDAGRHLLAWALEAGFTEITPSSSNWLYATPAERSWHADSWSQRVLHSAFGEQAQDRGLADAQGLQRLAAGWQEWAAAPEGWFLIPCGELLLRA